MIKTNKSTYKSIDELTPVQEDYLLEEELEVEREKRRIEGE